MDVTLSPRARTIVVWVAVVAGGFILFEAAHALKPFVWAIITAYILHPLVSFIHRKTRLPKHLITGWLYAMLGLVVVILAINLVPPLVDQVGELQDDLPAAVNEFKLWLEKHSNRRFGQTDAGDFIEERLDEFGQQGATILGDAAVPLLLSTVTVAIELVIYLIASFYFIVYGDRIMQAIRNLLNRRYHGEFDRLLTEVNATLGAYIRGQLLLVVIMSTASYIALTILHVNYALSVAIATGFLELIPLIGPWSAGTIAVSIALFQDSTPYGWSHVTLGAAVGLTYFALRQFEDAVVVPQVIGRIVHIHPLLVILVLVIGTTLGGILGLIIAVPVAAVLKILISFFHAKLMARENRQIEVIRAPEDLERAVDGFPDLVNATIVLLIEPDVLRWEHLPLVQRVANAALDHAIALSVVTPDGVAGALATAAGISTATIPASLPVAVEPIGR